MTVTEIRGGLEWLVKPMVDQRRAVGDGAAAEADGMVTDWQMPEQKPKQPRRRPTRAI